LTDKPSRYDTVVKRWPIILTNVIDHVHRLLHDMTLEVQQARGQDAPRAEDLSKKITEGQDIISEISRLKYRMGRDHELEYVTDDYFSLTYFRFFGMLIAYRRDIPQDGDILVAEYNADLERLKQASQNTWFEAPWLYAEWVMSSL
jgi:hypothetical protein